AGSRRMAARPGAGGGRPGGAPRGPRHRQGGEPDPRPAIPARERGMSAKRITMAALLALLWAPAWPAAAQVDVGAGGELAFPWTERLRLADPQGELRVTIALPPPDAAAPAEGFPVLYYTGTDADALMIDAMRRIGG